MNAENPLIQKYQRYFRALLFMRRVLPPGNMYFHLAQRLALYQSPLLSQKKQFLELWKNLGYEQVEKIWGSYLKLSGMANAINIRYSDFDHKAFRFSLRDPDDVISQARSQGALILSYHHHLAYPFCAALGKSGVSFNALTMDPKASALYSYFSGISDSMYAQCEKLFRGGHWKFLNPASKNNLNDELRQLSNGRTLISVHDFNNPFPNSRSEKFTLAGRVINAPVGAVSYATRRNIPVAVGYLTYNEKLGFSLVLHSLATGEQNASPGEILQKYFSHLEELLKHNPELWEGWAGLSTEVIENEG